MGGPAPWTCDGGVPLQGQKYEIPENHRKAAFQNFGMVPGKSQKQKQLENIKILQGS